MPHDQTRSIYPTSLTGQCRRVEAVTPSDTADLPHYAKALRIGTGGTLKILPLANDDDKPVTVTVVDGEIWSFSQVRRVFATGTTATDILAGFD